MYDPVRFFNYGDWIRLFFTLRSAAIFGATVQSHIDHTCAVIMRIATRLPAFDTVGMVEAVFSRVLE